MPEGGISFQGLKFATLCLTDGRDARPETETTNRTTTMKTFLSLAIATMLGSLVVPGTASATDPGHPRVNEVNRRLNNEQRRINNGVASGRLNPQQAGRLERGEQRIQQRESRDMAANGGRLTGRETANLNRAENRESGRINRNEGRRPGFFGRLFGRR